jgi:integrase
MKKYILVRAPKDFEGYPLRRAFYCKTKNEADELRLRIKRWKAEQRSPSHTLSFDDYDKRWLAYLRAHVGNLELLPEIVTHWERTAKTVTNPLTVETLCKSYVEYRHARSHLSKRTVADDRYIARRLIRQLGPRLAHEITQADIRKLIDTAASQSTSRKIYKVASLIFDFGKQHNALAIHPMAEMERPGFAYATPEILSCTQFRALLRAAETKFPELLPFLALAGFCGIRRAEMVKQYRSDQVLRWNDIDFNKRLIVIRDGVAKSTQRKFGNRRFIPMEPALIHWLSPHRQNDGPVVPVSDAAFRRQVQKLFAAAGISPEPNALRHSFASYWLAGGANGVGELAKRMGNSESVVKRHYVQSLSPDEGKAWFAIRRGKRSVASSSPAVTPTAVAG